MNKFLSLIFIAATAISCSNNSDSCIDMNDKQLVGNWKLASGDVTFSLYQNGTGSFEMNQTPKTTAVDASRINWNTFNGHTLVWDFYKDKTVWSYWVKGDTLNIHDGGIGNLGKPTIDENWQFVKQQ